MYTWQKLQSLQWMKKEEPEEIVRYNKYTEMTQEKLRGRKEIQATYNEVSKDNRIAGIDDGNFKFCIVAGNNSALVRRVLETREWWSELPDKQTTLFNFKWCQTSKFC